MTEFNQISNIINNNHYIIMDDRVIKRKTVIEVILRMSICIFVYFAIIISLLFLARYTILLPISWLKNDFNSFFIVLFIIFFILTIGILVSFVNVVAPLFGIKGLSRKYKLEINEINCPKLYYRIIALCDKIGVKYPKHIYLDADTNAFVYNDSNLGGLFFKKNKDLNIGLGLVRGLSVKEIEAIIAHELGHFSQKSMGVTRKLYYIHTVLYNLVVKNKKELEVEPEDVGLVKWISFKLNAIIRYITLYLYLFEQNGYTKLSIQMEYNADAVSYRTVGVDNFVSAMCKMEYLSNRNLRYNGFISKCISEKKIPDDYWTAYSLYEQNVESYDGVTINYNIKMSELLPQFCSMISINTIWDTHPSTLDRITEAKHVSDSYIDESPTPAWSLIPGEIKNQVGYNKLNELNEIASEQIDGYETPKTVEANEIMKDYPLNDTSPWFYIIIHGDIDEEVNTLRFKRRVSEESLFTRENAMLKIKYYVAQSDMDLLVYLKSQNPFQEVIYNGHKYSSIGEPIREHALYLDSLKDKCSKLDKNVANYLLYKALNSVELKQKYSRLISLVSIHHQAKSRCFVENMNFLVGMYNKSSARANNIKVSGSLKEFYDNAVHHIYKILETTYGMIKEHVDEEEAGTIQDILIYGYHPVYTKRDLLLLINVCNYAIELLDQLYNAAMDDLFDYAKKVIHEKE